MKVVEKEGTGVYLFMCPGCGNIHSIHTMSKNSSGAQWGFNGDINNPTFTPSLLVRAGRFVDGKDDEGYGYRCHSFIREGQMEFLGDCTHERAGRTLPLPDLTDEFIEIYKR